MFSLIFLSQVSLDISEALAYYNSISPDLGHRFQKALYSRFQDLKKHPYHYSVLKTKRNQKFRKVMLRTFPYKIVYEIEGDEIIVYGVIHGKRNPAYLGKRLKS